MQGIKAKRMSNSGTVSTLQSSPRGCTEVKDRNRVPLSICQCLGSRSSWHGVWDTQKPKRACEVVCGTQPASSLSQRQ